MRVAVWTGGGKICHPSKRKPEKASRSPKKIRAIYNGLNRTAMKSAKGDL